MIQILHKIKKTLKEDFAEICENPGLREQAKLMGKAGSRENQPRTKIFDNPGAFYNVLGNLVI